MRKPILVGVDSSPAALAAARYGAELAERRDAPLTLIHVFQGAAGGHLREAARESLEMTAAEIRKWHGGVTVETQLRDGLVAATLIDASEEALATVVGSRGAGGFAGLMLGSVAAHVAAHGHGPIVVVRPANDPDGPILVGYDGSEASRAALSYGVREALDQKKQLVVANVYWEEPWGFHPEPAHDPRATAKRKAEGLIAEGLELYLEEHPDLDAQARLIHSLNDEYGLTEESSRASLTVVGCRGLGGFAGLLLGSVSRTLVHHAASPVVVIHPSERE